MIATAERFLPILPGFTVDDLAHNVAGRVGGYLTAEPAAIVVEMVGAAGVVKVTITVELVEAQP